MKLFKKVIALVAVVALSVTSLVGCGKEAEPVDGSQIVMTVGDTEVALGVANFFVRYVEGSYEEMYEMYGMEMDWTYEVEEGVSYEESTKSDILESIQELYILDAHAEEYGVALTEDEKTAIDEAAAAFKEANTEEAYELVSGEYAAEYFRLITISEKMGEAVKATADTTVDEATVTQKEVYYVEYATTTTDDDGNTVDLSEDEIAALKTEAQSFLDAAKANGSLSAYAESVETEATEGHFNASEEEPELDEALITAADALELNGFTEVIEGESAIYVAQVTSLNDEEATNTAREEAIDTLKEEHYEATLDTWKEETEIKVNDDVWAQVSLEGLKVTPAAAEEEESEEDTTDDTTEETAE